MSLDYDGSLVDAEIDLKNISVTNHLLNAYSSLVSAHYVMKDISDLRTFEISNMLKSLKSLILLSSH